MKNDSSSPYVIHFISFPATRLVDHTGQYHQSIRTDAALRMAKDEGLDLVCFNKPEIGAAALCKIVDFGKWKYENEKQKKKNEKTHKKENKEIRFSPNIGDNDIAHKTKQINEFLDAGDDVLMVMKLKGRERMHLPEAEQKFDQIVSCCTSGKVLSRKTTGNIIFVRMSKHGAVVEKPAESVETKIEERIEAPVQTPT